MSSTTWLSTTTTPGGRSFATVFPAIGLRMCDFIDYESHTMSSGYSYVDAGYLLSKSQNCPLPMRSPPYLPFSHWDRHSPRRSNMVTVAIVLMIIIMAPYC
jgi:hypothetical protein